MEIVLKHVVGKSTLTEGFAVPRSLEDWVQAPPAGCKREIRLIFGDQSIPATLRRVNSEQRSVQVKYEDRRGKPFRAWLQAVFGASTSQFPTGFIEVRRVADDVFEVTAFPPDAGPSPSLHVEQWLFHAGAHELQQESPLAEIPAIIRSVKFAPPEGQAFYNRALAGAFASWGWESEKRVVPDLGLKFDFAKEGVRAEIEDPVPSAVES